MNVVENQDLSFTIEEVTETEMNALFHKGLQTMLEEVKGAGRFVLIKDQETMRLVAEHLEPKEPKVWDIPAEDYSQIVQIGVVQILKEHLEKEV